MRIPQKTKDLAYERVNAEFRRMQVQVAWVTLAAAVAAVIVLIGRQQRG